MKIFSLLLKIVPVRVPLIPGLDRLTTVGGGRDFETFFRTETDRATVRALSENRFSRNAEKYSICTATERHSLCLRRGYK